MEKKFSIEKAISESWEIIKNNLGFVLSLQIIVLLINVFPQGADFIYKDVSSMEIPLLAISVIFFILQLITNVGIIKIYLSLYDKNEERDVMALFSGVNYLFRYIWGSVIYGLIVFGGFLLLIVPGIIWSIKYQFFVYFIIDKGMLPMEALQASSRITEGQKMNLFLFGCVMMLVNFAGLLAMGVGLFVTIPLTSMAVVYVYRKLLIEGEVVTSATSEVVQN
jgi:uncharacterized membrane protein